MSLNIINEWCTLTEIIDYSRFVNWNELCHFQISHWQKRQPAKRVVSPKLNAIRQPLVAQIHVHRWQKKKKYGVGLFEEKKT